MSPPPTHHFLETAGIVVFCGGVWNGVFLFVRRKSMLGVQERWLGLSIGILMGVVEDD